MPPNQTRRWPCRQRHLRLCGRTEQLAELKDMLTGGQRAAITALQGMGGIGKTALAKQVADELKTDFGGGVFWADLEHCRGSAESILRGWALVCGEALSQEVDLATLVKEVRGLLETRCNNDGGAACVVNR